MQGPEKRGSRLVTGGQLAEAQQGFSTRGASWLCQLVVPQTKPPSAPSPPSPQLQATLSSQTQGESQSEKNMDCSLIASGCLFVPRLLANPAGCAGLRQRLVSHRHGEGLFACSHASVCSPPLSAGLFVLVVTCWNRQTPSPHPPLPSITPPPQLS